MLKIAIPNKGSLSDESIALFAEAGYRVKRHSRELKLHDDENQNVFGKFERWFFITHLP